jgi:hypothetical protein
MRHPLQPRRTTNYPGFWSGFGSAVATISADMQREKELKAKRKKAKAKKTKKK